MGNSINRRMRRSNNMAGLKGQLVEKENEIFGLSQKLDMQQMYLQEMGKVSTALKDIIVRELKITEKEVTDLLEKELDADEAEKVDELVKEAEATDPVEEPQQAIESIPESYQELATEGDKSDVEIRESLKLDEVVEPQVEEPKAEKKTVKKRKSTKKKEIKAKE